MATNNSINNQSQELTIDPGASGDSFVQFDINGTGEFRVGVDDDASDAFKISQGSALGTNDTFVVTASGEITKPLQSAFLAVLNSTLANKTGDGTLYTVVWDTEVFDQNGDFDGTSTFTAPVTGRYALDLALTFDDLGSGNTNGFIQIVTSNRSYESAKYDYGVFYDVNAVGGVCSTIMADMDASDTAVAKCQIDSGTLIVDLLSNGSSDPYNWFSGNLVC